MRKLIARSIETHGKKFRFLLAGALNTLIGLGLYPLLYVFLSNKLGYMGILGLSQFICVTFSFLTNKFFVFKTKGNTKSEYLKFFMFHMAYLMLNVIGLPVMVELLRMNPMAAQTIFASFIAVTSYYWHNLITFRNDVHGGN